MGTDRQPSAQDIRRLLAFLPRLYPERERSLAQWVGGDRGEDGTFPMPWPRYSEEVEAFFHLVGDQRCWLDYEYVPEESATLLSTESGVSNAGIPEIQKMLTYVLRGERFCDGFWEAMIREGHVRRLLERLAEIEREGLPEPQAC